MEEGLFNSPKIGNLMYKFVYEPYSNIGRLIYEFEDKVSHLFENSQAIVPRASDGMPPHATKFFFQNKSGKKLEVSIVESNLSFINLNFNKASTIIEKNVKPIFNYLLSNSEIKLDNIILQTQIQFPLKDLNYDISNDIFNTYFKFKKPENLKSSSFMYEEFKDEMIYSYTIGHYENASIDLPPSMLVNQKNKVINFLKLDQKYVKVTEKGVNVNITIRKHDPENKDLDIQNLYKKISKLTIQEINNSHKKIINTI